jgi:hypothetical protein
MITAQATVEGPRVRVDCAGLWESDSRGTQCGNLLRNTIGRGIRESAIAIEEVVIDFTKVDYGVGDGPAWAVLGKATRGVKITYIVGRSSGQCLRELFAITHLDQIINVVVVDGP